MINAGAVASAGTIPTNGANNVDNGKRPAVTTAVKPVRPILHRFRLHFQHRL